MRRPSPDVYGIVIVATASVCALAFPRAVLATIVAPVSLPTIVETAELIVIGDIAPPRPPANHGTVRIVRTLKGAPPATEVTFRWHDPVPDDAGLESHYGMLFLKHDGENTWAALAVALIGPSREAVLSPRADLPTDYRSPKNASTMDKVVGELRFAATDVDHPLHVARAHELLFSLDPTRERTAAAATSQGGPDPSLSQTAIAMRTIGPDLARVVHDRVANGLDVPPPLAILLRFAQDGDPSHLGPLTAPSADELTRQMAIYALRAQHSPASLEFLAAALDSGDEEVVYHGVMGLYEYAISAKPGDQVLSQHAPAYESFQKDATTYVDFWREWWRCEACVLGKPECDRSACDELAVLVPAPTPE